MRHRAVRRSGPGPPCVRAPHLDDVVDSISAEGGRACVNTTAVLVEGDPAPLARSLAERLAALPSLPPEDPHAVLPVLPVADARKLERHLLARASGTVPWPGGDGVVDELGEVLRPAVHQLDRPDAEQAGIELSFPCAWVARPEPTRRASRRSARRSS